MAGCGRDLCGVGGGAGLAGRTYGGCQPGPLCQSPTCCCYCPPTPLPSRADERVSSLPSHLPTAEGSPLTRRQYRRRGPKPVGLSRGKVGGVGMGVAGPGCVGGANLPLRATARVLRADILEKRLAHRHAAARRWPISASVSRRARPGSTTSSRGSISNNGSGPTHNRRKKHAGGSGHSV